MSNLKTGNNLYRGTIVRINEVKIGSITQFETFCGKQYIGRFATLSIAQSKATSYRDRQVA